MDADTRQRRIEVLRLQRDNLIQKVGEIQDALKAIDIDRAHTLAVRLADCDTPGQRVNASRHVDKEFDAKRKPVIKQKQSLEKQLKFVKREFRQLHAHEKNEHERYRDDVWDVLCSIEELLERLVTKLGA